jgi:hypothetical protein
MYISSVSCVFFYVASVASQYFKSRSGCCICAHDIGDMSGMGRNSPAETGMEVTGRGGGQSTVGDGGAAGTGRRK